MNQKRTIINNDECIPLGFYKDTLNGYQKDTMKVKNIYHIVYTMKSAETGDKNYRWFFRVGANLTHRPSNLTDHQYNILQQYKNSHLPSFI
mgnify:CR=1 FL=1